MHTPPWARRPEIRPGSFGRRAPRIRPRLFIAYWYVAHERQRVFEARWAGASPPWTPDAILSEYRFCNAFRASDRVSQTLIRDAAYGERDLDERDLFLRVVLYRLFSRPSTWELIEESCGPVRAATFDRRHVGDVLDRAMDGGEKLYTAAFILPPPSVYGHWRKHQNHLDLVRAMLDADVPTRLARKRSLKGVYEELRDWPTLGPFLAYQLTIDLNYSPLLEHSENDFVVPGPGAVRGIAKVFEDLNGYTPSAAIHWLVERQGDIEAVIGIPPPSLFGRPLHAVDCQNLLCEVDKYSRVAFPRLRSERTRIKQRFRPDSSPLMLFYPPKWGLSVPATPKRECPR